MRSLPAARSKRPRNHGPERSGGRVQEGPRRGLAARFSGHLDQRRSGMGLGLLKGARQRRFTLSPPAADPEARRELDEVWILQLRRDDTAAKSGLLIAQHIAEAAVIEHERDEIDLVLRG